MHSAFTLHDPSGELPEDAIAFSLAADGLHVHDMHAAAIAAVGSDDGEHVFTWAWHRITRAEGVRDSPDPTDMELLSLDILGVGNVQFECNDAKTLAALITAAAAKDNSACRPPHAQVAELANVCHQIAQPGIPTQLALPEEQARGRPSTPTQKSLYLEKDGDERAGATKMGKPMLSVFGDQGPRRSIVMVLAFFVASIVAYR